jgi:putative tryptophan/tyrosine transport system substrate-binding protein
MRRREFIGGLGSGLVLLATSAGAQQSSAKKRIAFVLPAAPSPYAEVFYKELLEELRRRGFTEPDNLVVDRLYGKGQTRAYDDLASSAVETAPDAILTAGGPLSIALKSATRTIPIVAIVSDPIALGLVSSLARPNANLTGVTVDAGLEIYGKRLALLAELRPKISKVGYLSSSGNWNRLAGAAAREAAQRANIELVPVSLGDTLNEAAYTSAFGSIDRGNIDALLASDEAEHSSNAKTLADLAVKARIPAMYPFSSIVVAGGLMAYSIDFHEIYKYAAGQMAEMLRGKSPTDIPFYQPIKFQFIINTKAAQRIGFEIPPSLLARADEVIE